MTSAEAPTAPKLSHILETALYVQDMSIAVKFYSDVFQTEPFLYMADFGAAFAIGTTTLLLFKVGSTDEDRISSSGIIPKHGPTRPLVEALNSQHGSNDSVPSLRQHYCFAASNPEEVEIWDERLQKLGVKILGRMNWERGGKSVYFEDPDGHIGEIGSRGIWPNYDLQ